jgi:UDP-N-acetyl-D-mannosaminuronate dehydrogenase
MKKELVNQNRSIAVWGVGYLGYTNIIDYSNCGIRVHAAVLDGQRDRLDSLERDGYPSTYLLPVFEESSWPTSARANVIPEHDQESIMSNQEILVHFFDLPKVLAGSHAESEAFCGLLDKHRETLFRQKQNFVFESIASPGRLEERVIGPLAKAGIRLGEHYAVAYAPRQDWSVQSKRGLRRRGYWASDDDINRALENLFEVAMCEKVRMENLNEAEFLVNLGITLEHIQDVFLMQVALAYPNVNVRNVVEVWNAITGGQIDFPVTGAGGAKMPVAALNLLDSANSPELASILKETILSDLAAHRTLVSMIEEKKPKQVAILGFGNRAEEYDDGLCPGLEIARKLQASGISVRVNDPESGRLAAEALNELQYCSFPDAIDQFDLILINSHHIEYAAIGWKVLERFLTGSCTCVIDTCGVWSKFDWTNGSIEYILVGG